MTCAVCDFEGLAVVIGVVHWADGRFEAVPRCTDRDACAVRCRIAGRVWPLVAIDRSRPPKVDPAQVTGIRDEYDAWARHQPPGVLDRRPPRIDPVTGRATFPQPLPVPPLPVVRPAPGPDRTPMVADDPGSWW